MLLSLSEVTAISKESNSKKGAFTSHHNNKIKKNKINVTEQASNGDIPLTVKYDNIANQLST